MKLILNLECGDDLSSKVVTLIELESSQCSKFPGMRGERSLAPCEKAAFLQTIAHKARRHAG